MLTSKALAAIVILAAAVQANAQRPGSRILTVPPVNAGQTDFKDAAVRDVLFDAERNELIVVTDAARRGEGEPTRIALRNEAEVRAEATIQREENGIFVYRYGLTCLSGSRDALRRWSLLAPRDPQQFASSPPTWRTQGEPSGMPDRIAAQNVDLDYVRFEADPGRELRPGNSIANFEVRSRSLPGFVSTFAESGDPADRDRAINGLPEPLRLKAIQALTPSLDSRVGIVLGPRYLPDASTKQIAAGYHRAITRFSWEGLLDRNSTFTTGALAGLAAHIQYGFEGAFSPTEAAFVDSASTEFETTIADALRWALKLKE